MDRVRRGNAVAAVREKPGEGVWLATPRGEGRVLSQATGRAARPAG